MVMVIMIIIITRGPSHAKPSLRIRRGKLQSKSTSLIKF